MYAIVHLSYAFPRQVYQELSTSSRIFTRSCTMSSMRSSAQPSEWARTPALDNTAPCSPSRPQTTSCRTSARVSVPQQQVKKTFKRTLGLLQKKPEFAEDETIKRMYKVTTFECSPHDLYLSSVVVSPASSSRRDRPDCPCRGCHR